jgi:thioredoxin 1
MSKFVIEVNESNYDAEVQQSPTPVVVDFWAPWCNPCMALMPSIEAVASMYIGKIKVVKINADENKPLMDKFGVRGIPYLAVVKHGEIVGSIKQHTRTRLAIEFEEISNGRGLAPAA